MKRTVVLNVVGLTPRIVKSGAPNLARWAAGAALARIRPAFPAVTCTAQSDYLTGRYPTSHGIVGNGWYAREDAEIRFWKQSNKLVQAPKIWERARELDPTFTCANVFWWYNMYSTADYTVTPRPLYPADGRKLPDVYTAPADLRVELQATLGTFPLFSFWGPKASIESSRWIAEAAKYVEQKFSPTLSLVYLPHLDYNLQRVGPSDPAAAGDVRQVDELCGDLIAFYESRGVQIVILSEYGLCDVTTPVHLNRVLRQEGLVAVREELGLEVLDPGASAAFAVADHQVAHVYVNDPSKHHHVRALIEKTPGVEQVLDAEGKAAHRIDHPRAGDLVAIAEPQAWFTYYYWLDDRRAPDFARTVDIHRKPGYDPVELLLDPAIRVPALTVGWKLAKKSLGFRMLMDVIPLDATLVRGSHGRPGLAGNDDGPVVMSRQKHLVPGAPIDSVDVYAIICAHLGDHPGPLSEPHMAPEDDFLTEIERSVRDGVAWEQTLGRILTQFGADSGTIHLLGEDGVLHLKAASAGIPQVVLDTIKDVPVGKGMAGLAVERKQPVDACNIQTDASGDVRPGARATGLQGSIVVPMLRGDDAIGALGVANRRERTFTDAEAELLVEIGKVLARSHR